MSDGDATAELQIRNRSRICDLLFFPNVVRGSRSRVLRNPETFVVSESGEYRFDAPRPQGRARCRLPPACAPDSGSFSATGRDQRQLPLGYRLLQQSAHLLRLQEAAV